MRKELAEQITAARATRQAVALVTWLASGEQRLISRGEEQQADELSAQLSDAFRLNRSGIVEAAGAELFIRIYNPQVRLIIIGAVHITQFLLPLARMLDYEVTIIDPRTAFASEERFPNARLITEWPEDALPPLGLDEHTALVALTHDSKIDDIGLRLALASPAFYIGALGSSRTHAKRLERLKASGGLSDNILERVHGPVGLAIGAQGPAEIALSIMAQVTAALRRKL